MADERIQLRSSDGESFEVDVVDARISEWIKEELERDPSLKELELPSSVTGRILAEVVTYMREHKGREPDPVEKPLKSTKMEEVVKHPWDADFIDRVGQEKRFLYDLVLAADRLKIPALLHLCCAKVASLVKGRPLHMIRKILNPDVEAETVKTE